MKTYILTLDESHEEVVKALAKALNIKILDISDADEDKALLMAMEEAKKYGRLSEDETKTFLDNLGK
jgi:plasmid maintenance system killer protein